MSGSAVLMAAAFLLPMAAAWLALECWWPGEPSQRGDRLFRLSLAGPLGAWFGALFFFVWALAFTPAGRAMVLVHAGLLLATIIVLVSRWYVRGQRTHANLERIPMPADVTVPAERMLARWACLVTGGLALCGFASCLLRNPHGMWDAWAMWNLRARFLYRSGMYWADSFSPDLFWSSPNYPLGLPGFVALAWKYVGSETVIVPMLVAAMFFMATCAVLYASLRRQSGPIAAALGLIGLCGTPFFIRHSAAQYADVPVGFFFLTSTALMASYDRDPDRSRGWLVLTGVAVSLAAWTKNEGLLFLAAFTVARVVLASVGSERARLGREAFGLLAGAAPTLAILAVFKSFLAPTDSHFATQSWGTLAEKLGDWSRYQEVATAFFKGMSTFGGGMGALVIVVLLLVGVNWREFRQKRWLSGMIVLGMMLTGFFFIYITTPQRLTWYMGVSLNRILLQLWPMTVFLVFLNLKKVVPFKSETG
ncbi:MAG: glycosyltransferase family 39 protein [candidate division Zixibacteria bacterium]|nr:glycosyltransferase family 39 protein [candidate division Zixibacteria bacterium]